jgi:hypothetical protein
MSVLSAIEHWYWRLTVGLVEVSPTSFSVSFGSRSVSLAWDEIDRIDVARNPGMAKNRFFVGLFGSSTNVRIDDLMRGFDAFEDALLARWPFIAPSFTRILSADPTLMEHATLWTRARKAG